MYMGIKELAETGSREKALKKMARFAGMSPEGLKKWIREGGSAHNNLDTWEPNKTLASGEVYTLKEVAEILKVTYRTALTYVENGSLMAVKIGGKWRVKDVDLEDFVTAKRKYDKDDIQEIFNLVTDPMAVGVRFSIFYNKINGRIFAEEEVSQSTLQSMMSDGQLEYLDDIVGSSDITRADIRKLIK